MRSANSNGSGGRRARMRIAVAAARDVRRALTVKGDVATDVAFQNDVNALLAAVSKLAWSAPEENTPAVEPVPAPARRAHSGRR